jgi:hypothetical protein
VDTSLREDAIELLRQIETTIGRYEVEQLVLAVVVGALVQVVCLVIFRVVGAVLGLAVRALAFVLGVLVALYLLDYEAHTSMAGDGVSSWLDRLIDLLRSFGLLG